MLQDAADLITPISYFTPLSSSHSNTLLLCWFLFFAWCKSCLSLFHRDVQLIWSLCLLLLVSRAPVHFSSSPQAVSCRRQLSPLAPLLPPAVEYPPPADKISRHWLHNCCQYYVKYNKEWVNWNHPCYSFPIMIAFYGILWFIANTFQDCKLS